jgi:hypothetical protein
MKGKRVERAKVIRAIRDKLVRDRDKYLESRRWNVPFKHSSLIKESCSLISMDDPPQ